MFALPRSLSAFFLCAVVSLFTWSSALQGAAVTVNTYTNTGNHQYTATIPGWGTITANGANYFKYDGEGYVVGLNGSTNSYTLASLNGNNDFLNTFDNAYFTLTFSQPIYSIQFDYEIFPAANSSTNLPDFTLKTGDGTVVFHTDATSPINSHSPNSGLGRYETEPQFIGNSGLWVFPNGVTTLEFDDWPSTIGIANLRFSTTPNNPIPEPPTWLLASMLFISIVGIRYASKRNRTVVAAA